MCRVQGEWSGAECKVIGEKCKVNGAESKVNGLVQSAR